jgi:hypothetical protein
MAEGGSHPPVRKICSSPSQTPSGILKREFAQLDRQYSYEHTVVSEQENTVVSVKRKDKSIPSC